MNGAEGDQRLWFAIDELDALDAIDGLNDALARMRKFGGRCAKTASVSSWYRVNFRSDLASAVGPSEPPTTTSG